MIVDTHLHVWRLSTGDYGWNTPDSGSIHADFGAKDAIDALTRSGVTAAILVQAADTVGDTERMLAIAEAEPVIAGVVAWVPLDDPVRSASLLESWQGRPVVGVRQLLHNHPDVDLLDDPRVRATCRLLAERGLPVDIPDAWPRLWPAVRRLVGDMPGLAVVLDHLGKPMLGGSATSAAAWERDLRDLAAHANVTAKLSGLGSLIAPGQPIGAEAVRPYVDIALSVFGRDRLMFGSDWPVSLAGGSYANVLAATVATLSATDRDAVLACTASRVYGIGSSLA